MPIGIKKPTHLYVGIIQAMIASSAQPAPFIKFDDDSAGRMPRWRGPTSHVIDSCSWVRTFLGIAVITKAYTHRDPVPCCPDRLSFRSTNVTRERTSAFTFGDQSHAGRSTTVAGKIGRRVDTSARMAIGHSLAYMRVMRQH